MTEVSGLTILPLLSLSDYCGGWVVASSRLSNSPMSGTMAKGNDVSCDCWGKLFNN